MEHLLGHGHEVHVRGRPTLQSAHRRMGYVEGGGHAFYVCWNVYLQPAAALEHFEGPKDVLDVYLHQAGGFGP